MAAVKYSIHGQEYSADELAQMCAGDPDLFYNIFFSRTVRQKSAQFHLDADALMMDPAARYILLMMFRDSAKTSRLRMTMGFRIAYGLSKTIFFLGASEAHGNRSVKWIRNQIERNKLYSGVFGLRAGQKWTENELEIICEPTGETCWVLGSGYTGNVRGINFDDYRPDFIVVDDVVTDENAATLEQREKVIDLVNNAIRNSLAPVVDDPNAKMVVAQTPVFRGDLTDEMKKDAQVKTLEVPIWTEETLDLPVEQQVCRWPERWPTEGVRADKQAAAAKNRLSGWIKEKEVRLVNKENRAFFPEWLKKIDIMPAGMTTILSIDPVPPPSEVQLKKNLVDKDYEALSVVGMSGFDYFVVHYEANRGHNPSWTAAKFFELMSRYGCTYCVVEGVAYQRTLKWILEEEMKRRRTWYSIIIPEGDKRSKYHKIVNTLHGIASNGHLYCKPWMTDLIQQWEDYPEVSHEDVLESVAQGLSRLINPVAEMGGVAFSQSLGRSQYRVPRLRSAP